MANVASHVAPVQYEPGGVWAICDRCGFKFRLSALKKEWSGLMVCPSDFDPRPDTLTKPNLYPEGVAVPESRPEPPDSFIQTRVTPDQL